MLCQEKFIAAGAVSLEEQTFFIFNVNMLFVFGVGKDRLNRLLFAFFGYLSYKFQNVIILGPNQ